MVHTALGSRHRGLWSAGVSGAWSASAWLDQAVALEERGDGASSGPVIELVAPAQEVENCLRAPSRMSLSSRDEQLHQRGVQLLRRILRCSGAVVQPLESLDLEALDDLVAGLAANLVF